MHDFKTRIRSGLSLVLTGSLLAALAAGCTEQSMQAASRGANSDNSGSGDVPRVETIRVPQVDLAQTVEMPGTVEGFETADLYSKVGGYLETIHVDIGDEIQKGQTLAELSIPEMDKQLQQRQAAVNQYEAEVVQRRASLEHARTEVQSAQAKVEELKAERAEKQADYEYRQAEYKRYKELVANNAARQELLDAAKAQMHAAEAALGTIKARIQTARSNLAGAEARREKVKADIKAAQARVKSAEADAAYTETMMDYSTIKAPFDGAVTRRYVHPGAFIQPAEGNSAAKPLLTVTRTDVVRIFVDIPMNDVRLLDRGDRAVLSRINVLPGEEVEGKVTRYSAAVDQQSRMMRVEIDLPNKDGLLRPGYYGYVRIYLEEMPDTPVVPSSALLTDGDEKYVYVTADGQAQRQPVTVNYRDGALVGIASGLQGGEEVLRAGGGQIEDGQPLKTALTQWEANPQL